MKTFKNKMEKLPMIWAIAMISLSMSCNAFANTTHYTAIGRDSDPNKAYVLGLADCNQWLDADCAQEKCDSKNYKFLSFHQFADNSFGAAFDCWTYTSSESN